MARVMLKKIVQRFLPHLLQPSRESSMTKFLTSVALAAGLMAAGSANAYLVFTGFDNNGNASVQVASTNSGAAETNFKNNLVGVGTENFETRSGGAPLALDFGAAGTATLNGAGNVATHAAGGTNGNGRYSVPGGTHYWEVNAGGGNPFQVDFSNSLAAFGFYGIDLGDFGGTLTLELSKGGVVVGSQIVPTATEADGSILYFGLIASNASEEFDRVRFLSTVGTGDVFAFDSVTIGTKEQIRQLPEPASLALVAGSLLGLGLARRRRA
jgi:hypothetical protein